MFSTQISVELRGVTEMRFCMNGIAVCIICGWDRVECQASPDELQSQLAKVTKERAEARGLLKMARCADCGGDGYIAHQVGEAEWVQEQCQWCYERDRVMSDG